MTSRAAQEARRHEDGGPQETRHVIIIPTKVYLLNSYKGFVIRVFLRIFL